jgi:hypothetical protein
MAINGRRKVQRLVWSTSRISKQRKIKHRKHTEMLIKGPSCSLYYPSFSPSHQASTRAIFSVSKSQPVSQSVCLNYLPSRPPTSSHLHTHRHNRIKFVSAAIKKSALLFTPPPLSSVFCKNASASHDCGVRVVQKIRSVVCVL